GAPGPTAPPAAALTAPSKAVPAVPPPRPPVVATTPSSEPPSPPVENTSVPREAASDHAPANASAPPESFGDIKTLVPDGTKTKELDVLLGLEPDNAVLRNRDNGTVIQTIPYRSIAAATYARAKRPRWKEDAALAPIPKDFGGSGFFL